MLKQTELLRVAAPRGERGHTLRVCCNPVAVMQLLASVRLTRDCEASPCESVPRAHLVARGAVAMAQPVFRVCRNLVAVAAVAGVRLADEKV